jgi:hypothetical protein
MPYLLIKTTLVAVILGLFASFAQAEATPRFPLNEVTTPATPVGYGRGYGGYGRYGGGYGRWYGGTAADTAAGTVGTAADMAEDTAGTAADMDVAATTTDEQ